MTDLSGSIALCENAQERFSAESGTGIHSLDSDGSNLAPRKAANAVSASCCGAWWTGISPCHCSGCHRTFSGISAFDRHRRGGKCLPPSDVGLVPLDRKWSGWGFPGSWEPNQ